MPPAHPKRPPAPTASARGRVERCSTHQRVRGVNDTAAFEILGEILHHLDEMTGQLNGLATHLTQTAEEVALIHSKLRAQEGKVGELATVAQTLKTVADSNARVLEELRKRVG